MAKSKKSSAAKGGAKRGAKPKKKKPKSHSGVTRKMLAMGGMNALEGK